MRLRQNFYTYIYIYRNKLNYGNYLGSFLSTIETSLLHNEELHNFYSSPSIIRMIKSRRMRWAGHVA
jgi:hypothetical protein